MTSIPPTHAHHHDRPGHGPASENDVDLAELLDLDAAHSALFIREALEVAATALGREPYEVVDLGAGTGTGTIALASRFSEARVHGLDASAAMLARVQGSSSDAGVSSRVETHLVDLDGDWPAALPGPVDLAWAALSLHHTSNPVRVLKQAFELLRPGGVAVVTEFTGATSYSPADLGTTASALGEHLVVALAARGYPVTADWTDALTAAGFGPVERHEATISVSSSTTAGTRFLELQLARDRQFLAEDLNSGDLAALDAVIASMGPGTPALEYTSGRVFWVAVRPDNPKADTTTTGTQR